MCVGLLLLLCFSHKFLFDFSKQMHAVLKMVYVPILRLNKKKKKANVYVFTTLNHNFYNQKLMISDLK
jgi:hypothetical protein